MKIGARFANTAFYIIDLYWFGLDVSLYSSYQYFIIIFHILLEHSLTTSSKSTLTIAKVYVHYLIDRIHCTTSAFTVNIFCVYAYMYVYMYIYIICSQHVLVQINSSTELYKATGVWTKVVRYELTNKNRVRYAFPFKVYNARLFNCSKVSPRKPETIEVTVTYLSDHDYASIIFLSVRQFKKI